jgi:hypothetical protein
MTSQISNTVLGTCRLAALPTMAKVYDDIIKAFLKLQK